MTNEELDKKLMNMFAHNASYNEQKHDEMLHEVMTMYASKTRLAKYVTILSIVISAMIILVCFWQFAQTENIKVMLSMTIIIVILYETTVLMKLWWWTVSSRNAILETLKTMQLQIAELQTARKSEARDNP